MRQMADLRGVTGRWRELERWIATLDDLVTLAIKAEDDSLQEEIHGEIEGASSILEELEFKTLFNGEYDARNAIIALHAGAGGTESQDWAEMLMRMYLRWAERHKYVAEVLDTSPGEEAGIKSATLEIRGDHAFGYLKSEHGVHRLVRLSPFDFDHARHTSFALVEVLPEAEEGMDVNIDPDELKVDVFRSSGPGGQHMQKTSTAVRLTHIPSGLVVNCQSQRSQHHNKETAMRILYARLLDLEMAKREDERAKLKGERIAAGWGNQIRSYVLHPYKAVKDHRTGYQTSDAAAVLDGELDELISSYLRFRVGEGK